MITITGGGSFTGQNISDINANFSSVGGGSGGTSISSNGSVDVWVRPQEGNNNTADGSYARPYATMSGLSSVLRPGMRVGILGVVVEEYSSPRVNDVTLVGMGNLPRQATTSSVPNGGGATWLGPSGGTGNLLQPNGQGWLIQNIFFNNASSTAGTGCIKLVNAGDPPTANCSEKTAVVGCILTGGKYGVVATDLPNNVLIDSCMMFGFTSSGGLAMASSTGAGTGTLSFWTIQNCDFNGNAGHITAPLNSTVIRNNRFSYIYGATTSTTQVTLTSGSNNSVYNNHFDIPYATNGLTAMFAGGTNDRWGPNQFSDAITTTLNSYGVPSS